MSARVISTTPPILGPGLAAAKPDGPFKAKGGAAPASSRAGDDSDSRLASGSRATGVAGPTSPVRVRLREAGASGSGGGATASFGPAPWRGEVTFEPAPPKLLSDFGQVRFTSSRLIVGATQAVGKTPRPSGGVGEAKPATARGAIPSPAKRRVSISKPSTADSLDPFVILE